GAISKTVNMPEDATVEDIMETYTAGWRLGLKAVAIYRDGSKKVQPLSASSGKGEQKSATPVAAAQSVVSNATASGAEASAAGVSGSARAPAAGAAIGARPFRRKLPEERDSITHKFSIAGHEGYITVGKYPDGTPGEIFIVMAKEGSTVSGLMDSFATAI